MDSCQPMNMSRLPICSAVDFSHQQFIVFSIRPWTCFLRCILNYSFLKQIGKSIIFIFQFLYVHHYYIETWLSLYVEFYLMISVNWFWGFGFFKTPGNVLGKPSCQKQIQNYCSSIPICMSCISPLPSPSLPLFLSVFLPPFLPFVPLSSWLESQYDGEGERWEWTSLPCHHAQGEHWVCHHWIRREPVFVHVTYQFEEVLPILSLLRIFRNGCEFCQRIFLQQLIQSYDYSSLGCLPAWFYWLILNTETALHNWHKSHVIMMYNSFRYVAELYLLPIS